MSSLLLTGCDAFNVQGNETRHERGNKPERTTTFCALAVSRIRKELSEAEKTLDLGSPLLQVSFSLVLKSGLCFWLAHWSNQVRNSSWMTDTLFVHFSFPILNYGFTSCTYLTGCILSSLVLRRSMQQLKLCMSFLISQAARESDYKLIKRHNYCEKPVLIVFEMVCLL